jgi:hypothetical protein
MEKEVKSKPSLIGMFSSPGEQFDRMRQNPTIWIPLILISVVYAVGMYLMSQSMDASYLGFEGMSKEEIEIALAFSKVFVVITGILTPAFVALISSAIYMIFTKIAGSRVSFKQLFSMNTHIMIIGAAGLVINMALRLVIGGNPDVMPTSLAALMNSNTPGVMGSFELFSIWQVIVTAIGLHRLAGLSKGWAWGISIGFFLLGLMFAYIGTLFSAMTGF